MLGGGDQLPALAELDDPAHAGEDDLVHVKRLFDEVRRAHLQRLELRALFGRQHDDGDAAQEFVLVDAGKHLEAVHFGHDEIQQHHGEPVPVFPDGLQGLPAVAGTEDLVVVLQDHAQQFPVDFLVVHDQYQLRFVQLFGNDHAVTSCFIGKE